MSSSFVFVQGDTSPDINAALHAEGGSTPVNLTGVTEVRFQMRKPDDRRFTVDNIASVVGSPTLGTVRYSWGPNDLAIPGEYDVQWRVTYADARKQTTATPQRITVRRR